MDVMLPFVLVIAVTAADPEAGPVDPQDGHSYRIVNLASGKALDVIDSSKLSPAALIQADLDQKSESQVWRVEKSNIGFKLINALSGHAVDVPRSAKKPGAALVQYGLHGGANQQWELVRSPRPPGWAIRSLHSKLMITAPAKNSAIVQLGWVKRAEQLWRFEPVSKKNVP